MILRRRRIRHLERKRAAEHQSYRTPVQVCPRGCEYRELARRNVLTRTEFWGRVALRGTFDFEATNCPRCGALLIRRCVRCSHELYAPVSAPIADRCQSCGFPQPWSADRRVGEQTVVRYWRPPDERAEPDSAAPPVNDPARELYDAGDRGGVWVIEGDIPQLAVDAVVSDDDVQGRMWSQVAGAIKRAAGAEVERLAQVGRPFRLGYAWATEAGELPMRGIIHVASMDRHGESDVRVVRKSLKAALEVAAEERYESVGIAAIGTGPAAMDRTEWFEVFAEVTIEHLDARQATELAIVLVLFEPTDFDTDVESLQRAMWDAWDEAYRPSSGQPVERRPFDTRRSRWRLRIRVVKRAVKAGVRSVRARVARRGRPERETPSSRRHSMAQTGDLPVDEDSANVGSAEPHELA